MQLSLLKTAYTQDQLIFDSLPKVVFAGRSNVGKSSLLNALAGQKLAKISSTPGKTQSINYYTLQLKEGYLVDLPGYGFARASHADRLHWQKLIETFFQREQNIVLLCILLDARLPPQENDVNMIRYAQDLNLHLQGVLTKADKCSRSQLNKIIQSWQHLLTDLLITSASKKIGVQELETCILGLWT